MTIRIGANPIGWSNDDLQEIGGDIPLETCLREAQEAGIAGMEMGNKFPKEAGALKAALKPFGMAFVGAWHSVELLKRDAKAEFAAAAAQRALSKALGTSVFIVAECSNTIHGDRSKPLSSRPIMATADWVGYGRRLTEFADMLAAEGFKLCYHHHMGTIVQTRADIDALMKCTGPNVHLLLDTGHATWGGSDPAELARAYAKRISHVHCKDVRPAIMAKANKGDWSFLDSIIGRGEEIGVYTVPGDGCVDYVSVFKALPGYSGWVVLEAEQDPKKADPLTYAKKGVANLRRYLKEAGLT